MLLLLILDYLSWPIWWTGTQHSNSNNSFKYGLWELKMIESFDEKKKLLTQSIYLSHKKKRSQDYNLFIFNAFGWLMLRINCYHYYKLLISLFTVGLCDVIKKINKGQIIGRATIYAYDTYILLFWALIYCWLKCRLSGSCVSSKLTWIFCETYDSVCAPLHLHISIERWIFTYCPR